MASAGAYAAAGLTLLALHSRGKKSELLLLLFAGIALGIEFVSKPPSGVVTWGLVIAWVLIFGRQLSAKMSGVAVTIAGLTACVLLLAMTQTTLSDSSHALTRGLDLFRMVQTEPTTNRLWRYVLEFTQHSLTALLKFSVPILVAALYLYTRRALFLILTAIALAHTIWFDGYFLGGSHHSVRIAQTAIALSVLAILTSVHVWIQNLRVAVLLTGLAILPYTVAVGTGNSIVTQVIISMAPWGAAIGALVVLHGDDLRRRLLPTLLFVVFMVTVSSQIISSGSQLPYHIQHPLVEQSSSIAIGALGSVSVDKETASFVADLKAAANTCSIVRGTPFLGLYNIPGVALALEAVPQVTPWLNNVAQANAVLEHGPDSVAPRYVVAIQLDKDGNTPPLPPKLGKFRQQSRFCGRAVYPFARQVIEVWLWSKA